MNKHGFAHLKDWKVENTTETSATFLLTDPDPGFPFQYELRVKYILFENSICITYNVKNNDKVPFCYCMGAHEGFALHYSLEDYFIHFPQTEDIWISKQIGNLIIHEESLLKKSTVTLTLSAEQFVNGALILRSLKSRTLSLECKRDSSSLAIQFPDFNVLILWTKPNAKYLCIEPWTSSPDYIDADGQITHKPGTILLQPGEEKTLKHTVEFQPV